MGLTKDIKIILELNKDSGISSTNIARKLDVGQNVISGILSQMKMRGKVSNLDGKWYLTNGNSPQGRTIKISNKVYEKIASEGKFGESVNDVLERILGIN
jgi:Mn-dependent DtxR family transcriptional regulator